MIYFFFSSRRRHTRSYGDWSSDVCSSDLRQQLPEGENRSDHTLQNSIIALAGANRLSDRQDGSMGKRVQMRRQIGRASCRERVWMRVGGGSVKKKEWCGDVDTS